MASICTSTQAPRHQLRLHSPAQRMAVAATVATLSTATDSGRAAIEHALPRCTWLCCLTRRAFLKSLTDPAPSPPGANYALGDPSLDSPHVIAEFSYN